MKTRKPKKRRDILGQTEGHIVIEWAAIAKAVTPHIAKYVTSRAGKIAVTAKQLARVNEIFVEKFSEELAYRMMDVPNFNTNPYEEALKYFLGNENVQELLRRPLDGESAVDGDLLGSIWTEFRLAGGKSLNGLPKEFDWVRVSKTYRQAVQKLMLADPELRSLVQTVAVLRAAEVAVRSAGPSRVFDLGRYAAAIRAAFGYLRLGSLDPDWIQYERRVRLENVYVPQKVKEALPPRDLTRDYRQKLRNEGRTVDIEDDEERMQLVREKYSKASSRALMEVVDDSAYRRLVILGDPGLGKSTLLKHLTLRWTDNLHSPLALFIELRQACSTWIMHRN